VEPLPGFVGEARAREDRSVLERLRRIARELGSAFGLRPAAIEAERDGVTGHYGICYASGLIRIRLRHAVTGRLLKESSLVDTLCHELAHLRYLDHGPRFEALYLEILAEARRLGHYRPRAAAGAAQPALFDFASCGIRRPPEPFGRRS